MNKNVGGVDKIARIVIGFVLIVLAATGAIGTWGWIGVVPLATGIFSRCGLYRLLGINTCPMKK